MSFCRSTLATASALAALYGRKGLHTEHEVLLTETLTAQRASLGEHHLDTLVTRQNLTKIAYDRGDFEAALAEYSLLTDLFSANYPDHFFGPLARAKMAQCMFRLGRFEDAEREYLAAHSRLTAILGPTHPGVASVARSITDFYEAWGRPEEAERWSAIARGDAPARASP